MYEKAGQPTKMVISILKSVDLKKKISNKMIKIERENRVYDNLHKTKKLQEMHP